jgi:hypothetical protein
LVNRFLEDPFVTASAAIIVAVVAAVLPLIDCGLHTVAFVLPLTAAVLATAAVGTFLAPGDMTVVEVLGFWRRLSE